MQKKLQFGERKTPVQTKPYTALAEIYDRFMDHVDYHVWADYVLVLCHKHGHPPGLLLDAACGTGAFISEFAKRGFEVYGCDRSIAMLKKARLKLLDKGNDVWCNLVQSDITLPCLKNSFNTVFCMYDSMNYQPTLDHIVKAVRGMLSLLDSNGVLIFDMSTEYNSLEYFENNSSLLQYGQYQCKRESYYNKIEKKQMTNLTITDTNTGEIQIETHIQYMYPVKDIFEILRTSIEGNVAAYKDYSFKPLENNCERAHFYIEKT